MPPNSGAEQDRYAGWFGGNKADQVTDAVKETVRENMPRGSGAEQDRLGGWFGGNKADQVKDAVKETVRENMPTGSGAEQDRYGNWLGGDKGARVGDAVRRHLPEGSGAEQDRYGNWFGGDKGAQVGDAVKRHLPQGSGAEQDRYAGWFGGDKGAQSGDAVRKHLPEGSGAEQDRLGGWFGGDKGSKVKETVQEHLPSKSGIASKLPDGSGAEQDTYGRWFGGDKAPSSRSISDRLPRGSGAEQDRYGSHFGSGRGNIGRAGSTGSTIGLLQGAVLPSFAFHSGLGAIAYGVGRYTDRVDGKDWLWPAGQVANAWWSAVGTRVVYGGLSVTAAWASLRYDEKLLLVGVSTWGIRLFHRIVSRSLARGRDDARYTEAKKDANFWNKAPLTTFLPEVVAQTLISLPFTLPFVARLDGAAVAPAPESSTLFHSLAVFLFNAGFALETLADWQLESHKRSFRTDLNREGVWSIVRHPNYLGDALCHYSFPVLLYSAGLLHPLAAVGPVVNHVFLRYIGGDKENEMAQEDRYAKTDPLKYQELQEYRQTKNSFWPSIREASNKWVWTVAAIGIGAVALEQALVGYLRR